MALLLGKRVRRGAMPSAPAATTANKETVGSSSIARRKVTEPDSGSMRSLSATGNALGGAQIGAVALDIDMAPMMDGMNYEADDKQLFDTYRDIYYFDPICGSTVDLFSTLPFSDNSFSGAPDSILEAYYEVNERLKLTQTMPNMSTDIKVTGAYVGSMLYSKEKKSFVDLMNHRYDNLNVIPLPFNSQDPIFELNVPEATRQALQRPGARMDSLRSTLGEDFVSKFTSGDPVELDPLGTIYVPRRTFSFGEGVSFFRRVLPIWLIEKNLYRGTLIESGRRQRGILHAQMGDGDQWEPSPEEMDYMTDLLLSADSDPIGSIITTRLGVNISEFRQGGDFWKITDIWDQTSQFKMRAMGISESFLSGEATFDNQSAGLTAFTEYMKAFRDSMTRSIYYDKVFPLVSLMNGYVVGRHGKISRRSGLMDGGLTEVQYRLNDGSKLFIPNVHWSKHLRPDTDQAMMENLRAMTELGVPVPLRTIAAAGGINFNQLLMDQDEDLALRHKLAAYKQRQREVDAKYGGGDAGGDSYSSTSSHSGFGLQSSVLGEIGRPSFASRARDMQNQFEMYDIGKTGKKKHIIRQGLAQSRANDKIWKAAQNFDKNRSIGLDDGRVSHKASARESQILGRM